MPHYYTIYWNWHRYSILQACLVPLSQEDGHDRCPLCLGIEYLRQALTDDVCINSSCMPLTERTTRLAWIDNTLLRLTCLFQGCLHVAPFYLLNTTSLLKAMLLLIISRDEALSPNKHYLRPQVRIPDDLLTTSYAIATYMGHIGNSSSHVVSALSQTLHAAVADVLTQSLSDLCFKLLFS